MSHRTCFAHNHLTPEEFGVYEYARRVSHDSGVFYFDGRGVASQFSSTGKNSIYRIVNGLVAKGWFIVHKERGRNALGVWDASQYVLVSHDDWVKSHPGHCGQPVPKSGQAPVPNPGQVPVPVSEATSPDFETDQSRNREQPVPKLGHKSVKRNMKRKESEEKSVPPSAMAPARNQPFTLSDPSGGNPPQDWRKRLVEIITTVAHEEAIRQDRPVPMFSKKSTEELCDSVETLRPLSPGEIRHAVRQVIGTCDEFMMRNFGKHLATNLAALIRAARSEAEREEAEEEREVAKVTARFISELTARYGKPSTEPDTFDRPAPTWHVGGLNVVIEGGEVVVLKQNEPCRLFGPTQLGDLIRVLDEAQKTISKNAA